MILGIERLACRSHGDLPNVPAVEDVAIPGCGHIRGRDELAILELGGDQQGNAIVAIPLHLVAVAGVVQLQHQTAVGCNRTGQDAVAVGCVTGKAGSEYLPLFICL